MFFRIGATRRPPSWQAPIPCICRVVLASLLTVAVACGRLGYDPVGTDGDAEGTEPPHGDAPPGSTVPPDDMTVEPGVSHGEACERHEDCTSGLLCSSETCAYPNNCAQLKAERPNTPDGPYALNFDRTEPLETETHFCDMTRDEGGWMLVSPTWILSHTESAVTLIEETDARGGLISTVYANAFGCGDSPFSFHRMNFADLFVWTELRFTQRFVGRAGCYSIFGDDSRIYSGPPGASNLIPFELGTDTIREEIRMGAIDDAFDGVTGQCSQGSHFMNRTPAELARRAEVILRRNDPSRPSGLGTGLSCVAVAEGTESPTFVTYSDIYIR